VVLTGKMGRGKEEPPLQQSATAFYRGWRERAREPVA
jgi:hypothetical protein